IHVPSEPNRSVNLLRRDCGSKHATDSENIFRVCLKTLGTPSRRGNEADLFTETRVRICLLTSSAATVFRQALRPHLPGSKGTPGSCVSTRPGQRPNAGPPSGVRG